MSPDIAHVMAVFEQTEIERLQAEVTRLRGIIDGAEVLAINNWRGPQELRPGGAWLYPGDKIVVLRSTEGQG